MKIVEAGCDQFGGEELPDAARRARRAGRISEERIDESARRLLRDKFRLGLFDDPYVDPDAAERDRAARRVPRRRRARRSAARSCCSRTTACCRCSRPRLYVEGVDPDVAHGESASRAARGGGGRDLASRRAVRAARGLPREHLPRGRSRLRAEPSWERILALARRVPTVGRRLPRPAGRDPGDRRPRRGAGRQLRRERRSASSTCVFGRSRRPAAAVRAAVVDGGGARTAPGRPVRLRGARSSRSGTG